MSGNYFAWWSDVVKMKYNVGNIRSAVRWRGTTDRTDFEVVNGKPHKLRRIIYLNLQMVNMFFRRLLEHFAK